jgi:hypothetical protein
MSKKAPPCIRPFSQPAMQEKKKTPRICKTAKGRKKPGPECTVPSSSQSSPHHTHLLLPRHASCVVRHDLECNLQSLAFTFPTLCPAPTPTPPKTPPQLQSPQTTPSPVPPHSLSLSPPSPPRPPSPQSMPLPYPAHAAATAASRSLSVGLGIHATVHGGAAERGCGDGKRSGAERNDRPGGQHWE